MGVKLRVDGVMVLAGAAVAGGVLLYAKRGELLNAVNPTHSDNLAHRAANAAVGEENFIAAADRFFAAQELLIETFTPFGDGDTEYAKSVWGIGGPEL